MSLKKYKRTSLLDKQEAQAKQELEKTEIKGRSDSSKESKKSKNK